MDKRLRIIYHLFIQHCYSSAASNVLPGKQSQLFKQRLFFFQLWVCRFRLNSIHHCLWANYITFPKCSSNHACIHLLPGSVKDNLFMCLRLTLPLNHLESCLTVRRAGLSPRLRYMTASMARKSVTVPVKRLPSSEWERRTWRRRGRRKRWSESTRSGRLKPHWQCSDRSDYKSFVKVNTTPSVTFSCRGWKPSLKSATNLFRTRDTTCE